MSANPSPRISIVIPSFNQGQYIEDTITSILDQNYPDVEIFVFDGGSKDSTVEVLKKYERHLTCWVSEKDKGQTDAINKGLRRATGQILAYLNSDDFFLPNALPAVAQAYLAHPEAGLYTGNGLMVDGHKEQPRLYMRELGYTYDSLLRGSCYLLQPSTFINRKAWEKTGEFDDSLRFAMDLDYWLRVGRDFEVVLVNAPLSAWRMHEDIKTANGGMTRWNELWRLYRKYTNDQITPGLLVELFSVLKSPLISQQLGMDIRGLAGQCFNTLYAEMQKTLKLSDCIPVGQGTVFRPVPPSGPQPVFRAYPPQPAAKVTAPQPAAVVTEKIAPVFSLSGDARPRVDIVLQATGVHAWAVGGGWENAARKLGLHHRTFRPRGDWGATDVKNHDGLFDYLANPQADILLLAGFDWHSQPLHSHPRWEQRWLQCPARKILYVQESVLNHERLSGSKVMEHAFRRAAALVDAIIYTDLADRALMESAGKPVLFQPFGVDDQVFVQTVPFGERLPRAFFRGKHQPFAGQAAAYGDRRALIQHLLDHQALELVPYQQKPVTPQDLVADFNRFQVAANFPSVFANHPTRIYEAMACGCAVVTNRTGIAEIDRQFEHGRHLFYYSNRDELLAVVQRLAADPVLAVQVAAQGRQEVLEKHALHHRLAQAVAWVNTLPSAAPKPAAEALQISSPPREAKTIVIDGVIFDWQRGCPHGVSRVWHRVLEELAKTPFAKDIVVFDRDGTAPVIPGIRRRTVAAYDRQHFESDSLWLQRWCDEEKAALFISTYFTYAETTPTVLMLHDMIPELTGQNLAQPEWQAKARAIKKAIGYFAVSQSTVNDFHRLHPELAARKIFLTPNAVGNELNAPAADAVRAFRQKHNIQKPYFLLVGNRGHYKNAQLFFRAFAQLPRCGQYEIVCVGGGQKLETDLEKLVPGVTCHMLRISDEELSAAYGGALALAYPSRYEGFGLPILEAQKCGCPVITCRNSSLTEVGGDSVIFVGEADEAAMRQALLNVQRPEVRQTLISAGTKNICRFSWENTGHKVAGAIQTFHQVAAALPPQAGDSIDTIRRFIFILDQGDDTARKLSVQLRIITWQYEELEYYSHQRAGAAEAAAAVLMNHLSPRFLNQIAPLADLDRLTTLVLGLAAENRKDWGNAWAFYSHALTRPSGGILGFRLALRLARIAASGGDAAMAESVKQKIVPKLRLTLPPTLNAGAEEKAVLDWPVAVQNPARSHRKPARLPSPATAAPLVTAIVSTFKSERFMRGCLEDLEAQTIADRLEIIVVDSHSPQNERAIVEEFQKRYSNIVYIRTQERETVYGAWNRGARAARGRYLTNANTDDRHRADALEILARTLDENSDVSLAYADCLITSHENETFDTGNPIGSYHWLEFSARDLWSQGCFAGPQPMWRREVHEEHGYFDAQMISAGDYEFWLRLAQNRKFLHVHEVLGLYLKSPTSVEHANRDVGAREVKLSRERYRDSIMAGKPPFRPKLPDPTATVEIMTGGETKPLPAEPAAPKAVPAVARLGQLNEARELFARKNYEAACGAALTAIAHRPFHPAAFLLLAEIALAAGDGKSAKKFAQRARDFAPGWPPVKQFLCKPLKGEAKLAWLQPSAILPPPATPRLSVCLIVKNEQRFLAQCLKSVRGLAAQLIVVDTGSTDRTVEIAREFGAEIYSFAWCDDFAAARNAALEHASGDWILMLDADEELPPAQHARLLADLRSATTIACRLPLINVGQENEGRSFIPRLFRNAPEVFYHGRIHEQVFPSLLVSAKKWGLKTALGTAEILHHGYTKELVRDRNKVERNLKLLRAATGENPADPNLLMNLGLELVRSDDLAGGIEKYREAYDLMSAQPAAELVPELREVLLTQFTSQLYKVRAQEEVVQVLNSPLAQHGGLTASLHLALGLAYFELKQFSEAADQMRQCLIKRKQPALTPVNTDIFAAPPQHCFALCLVKLGDLPGAEKAFVAALAETGPTEAARLDYAKFLKQQNRPVDALKQLHDLVTTNARNISAWRLGAEIALGSAEFLEFARDWTGEAFQALPDNPIIAAQRAEALMLNGDPSAAAPLWEKLWSSEPDPRTLAALILCEVAAGLPAHLPNAGPDELATSRAFVERYQQLIAIRAKTLMAIINARLHPLSRTLPTAAQMLQTALSEAGTSMKV
jgi:glycosyltransferase involved in cell wall biosynthesis